MVETIRVLQVGKYYPPVIGGMEVLVRSVALALAERPGIEVEALVSNDAPVTRQESDGRVEVTRLSRLGQFRGIPLTPSFFRRFGSLNGVDIVHIHSPNPPAEIAWLAARPQNCLVASAWGQIRRQRLLRRFYNPVYREYFSRSDAVAMPSLRYAETYDLLRDMRHKFVQVPVGLDPKVVALSPEASSKLSELRMQYPGPNVLFVGRLVPFKGAEFLIRAAPEFESHVLLVGDGPLRGSLEALARSLGVAGRIHFLGTMRGPGMVAAYHAGDIYAQTSINASEAYSGSLIEAGFCGKPAITTEIYSGTSEVNLAGVTGLVVPPRDEHSLAAAVRNLEGDAALRQRMGRFLQERVLRDYTIERMADSLDKCYRAILAGRASGRAVRAFPEWLAGNH